MEFVNSYIISILILLPVLGGLISVLVKEERRLKLFSGLFSTLIFLVSLHLYWHFDLTDAGFQFMQRNSWIPLLGANYFVGVDGISLLLVLLTTFITPIIMVASFQWIKHRFKEFLFFCFMMEAAMIGSFVSLNLFLFYVFWEAMLLPMFFLILIWGSERRRYAAFKLFLYTATGSLIMLAAIIYMGIKSYQAFGGIDFDLPALYSMSFTYREQFVLFLACFLAFAIKVPMFPFHTWLPDAHVEAPAAGSVVLASILLKLGVYGLIRIAIPCFTEVAVDLSLIIMLISVVGIVYGALTALVQPDIKKLVAYSSISHLGFVTLGLFTFNLQAVTGSVLQMINHGISTGALFLMVGILYDRRHTKDISEFGGLAKIIPWYSVCFLIFTLSSIGLPATNGFVGEFLILLGTFVQGYMLYRGSGALVLMILAVVATTGVILSAYYMLRMVGRVIFNPLTNEKNFSLKDLSFSEAGYLLPLIFLVFWIGIYPKPFTQIIETTGQAYLQVHIIEKQGRGGSMTAIGEGEMK